MKLNFEICKKCKMLYKDFSNYNDFCFLCSLCGYFVFNVKSYKPERFVCAIKIEDITEEEWIDINQMEIIKHRRMFNYCPFKLEHLVENP